jgi:hypothetical protein
LLQRAVVAYRSDPACAEQLFREALAAEPRQLAIYYCHYKINAYQGKFRAALAAAEAGLIEATRQAGWSADYRDWLLASTPPDGAARFALYTLKALAFIHLR